MTHRAAVLAEERMMKSGQGAPPCAYAFVVLGSAGRGESLLAMDQDNAIVFADGEPDGVEDRWFAALGTHVADILHEVGVPYCPGGVMAKNAPWRGSLAVWRSVCATGSAGRTRRISCQSIFSSICAACMGMRPCRHALARGPRLRRRQGRVRQAAGGNRRHRGAGAQLVRPLQDRRGRIDLKKAGLFGIVSAARALAIRHHVAARPTPAPPGGD